MGIVIIRQDKKIDIWRKAIKAADINIPVYSYLEEHSEDEITMALVWKHPHGTLKNYPNLKCIASSGAGVDFIFEDPDTPRNLPITRVVDTMLAKDMSEHVIAVIFSYLKNLGHYKVDQNNKVWHPVDYKRIADCTVGILGLGALGKVLSDDLVRFGFRTQGWSNSTKAITGVKTYAGQDELGAFLASTEILVCLLPLTAATEGILNKKLFQQLPRKSYLINVARGGHLVDDDLIEMIDAGHLSGACLDVYHQEPLATDHPFWSYDKIHMTPHYAAVSEPKSVIPQIIENYYLQQRGEPLLNQVSKKKGY